MLTLYDRCYGALLGLAYGDAIGYPALFHRAHQFPEKRREFLWRTNRDLARQRILRLTLPFTHRLPAETLEPFPTDDSEYAVFTAQTLLAAPGEPEAAAFLQAWQERILPLSGEILTGFSERAAIENLRHGVLPPASGNDNPQHYDDSAVPRAMVIGLYCAGRPQAAAELAQLDAQITNAEDGVWAAEGMAAATAVLAGGGELAQALERARAEFPSDSWIAHGDRLARECAAQAIDPYDLALLLSTRLINTVYSYGNAAPETFPAALALVEACRGDLQQSVLLANAIPKSADSLPAMTGALAGAYQGYQAIGPAWRQMLDRCRGLCLPFTAGISLQALAADLAQKSAGTF